jgi:hypothetical protein
MIIYKAIQSVVLTVTLLVVPFTGYGKEVVIPITLDYELLDALLITTSYSDPGQTAELVNEGNGCIELRLSDPRFSGEAGVVHLRTALFLHIGTPFGENCLMPYQWQGSVQVSQVPKIDARTWELSFETVDTRIFTADNQQIERLDIVFDRLMPILNSYLQDFSVKLGDPVDDLRTFILPMFTPDAQKEAEILLQSIRPGVLTATAENVVVTVHADARAIDQQPESSPPAALSAEEMESFLDLWETWDSLLVYLITILVDQPLSQTEKQLLMDLLLETRYEFVDTINDPTVQKDFVRDQFIKGWQLMSDIFRRHLLHNPSESRLGYLSFITAAEALKILDELGPAFGIEISREGLVRLAKIVGGENIELHYAPGIDGVLQQLFDVTPDPDGSDSRRSHDTEIQPDTSSSSIFRSIESFFLPAASAAALPSFADIKKWQAPATPSESYIGRVRKVLDTAVTSVVIRKERSKRLNRIYRELIPAIAWQESCFRQFVVKDRKLTYLLSYNNSSVGLMQINERVWRGIYDSQRLRWDIHYNAGVGSEIADLYLQKYAVTRYGDSILAKPELLAQLVYAMYNGGPSQYEKFFKRKSAGKLFDSDRLFAQKYDWVQNQAWEHTRQCF